MKYALAATLLLAGCGGNTTRSPADVVPLSVSVDALAADSIAHAMVQRAFDADARLETPDSLYLSDAEIIANGAPRADAPRIAGIAADGSVQLGSSRFSVTGNLVWGTIQYRWVPPTSARPMVDGWATFVVARRRTGEWRIVHIHSSTTRPVPSDSTS